MKRKQILAVLFLAAGVMALDGAPTWAQSQGNKDSSVGGTQNKRAGDSDTPMAPGSEKSPGSTSQPSKGTGQSSKDTSVGGTQSKRAGDSDTPVAPGTTRSHTSSMGGQQDVRLAQEALKNQGHNPGPIDGVMGYQTRQALMAFQSQNGLKQTGVLDAQTKQKLNIEDSSAGSGKEGPR